MIESYGPDTIAAFIAEPVAGATLAAAVPCEDYWPSIVEVCRRHGVLVIADEVMTGFGRTGRWFGVEHWDVRPDIVTAGKGTTSGYVPFGFAACTGAVVRGDRPEGLRPRLHLVAQRARRRGRARRRSGGCATTGLVERARDVGGEAPGRPRGGARRHPRRRRRPRSRDDDRDRAGRRPRHEGAVRRQRAGDRGGGRRRARRRAAPVLLDRPRGRDATATC